MGEDKEKEKMVKEILQKDAWELSRAGGPAQPAKQEDAWRQEDPYEPSKDAWRQNTGSVVQPSTASQYGSLVAEASVGHQPTKQVWAGFQPKVEAAPAGTRAAWEVAKLQLLTGVAQAPSPEGSDKMLQLCMGAFNDLVNTHSSDPDIAAKVG